MTSEQIETLIKDRDAILDAKTRVELRLQRILEHKQAIERRLEAVCVDRDRQQKVLDEVKTALESSAPPEYRIGDALLALQGAAPADEALDEMEGE